MIDQLPRRGDRVTVTFTDGSHPATSTVLPGAYDGGDFAGWEAVDCGTATVQVITTAEETRRRNNAPGQTQLRYRP